jgi:hypothetical protein
MKRKSPKETPIERIFREVIGRKMNATEKHILLRKPKYKLKPYKFQQVSANIPNRSEQ